MHFQERIRTLKTDIPAIFLALKDRETPILAKVFAGITVAYALSPIDLVPDFITIFYKGIMPSEKVLDFPVDCNTLTGSVNL